MRKTESQYRKIVTINKLDKLKKSLPEDWRTSLPTLASVSVATIDNFFRGQKVKFSTVQKILDAIEQIMIKSRTEISQIENKFSKLTEP